MAEPEAPGTSSPRRGITSLIQFIHDGADACAASQEINSDPIIACHHHASAPGRTHGIIAVMNHMSRPSVAVTRKICLRWP